MLITYRSRFLVRGEVWFDNEPNASRRLVDWLFYHQCSRPVPRTKVRCFYTFLIDLSQSQYQLLAHLEKNTAYKIRRARERDKITCEWFDPRERTVMDRFEQMYNLFAATKGLRPLERARMESLAAAGLLDLSAAKDTHGNALLYHANYCDQSRAASLELPSLYRMLQDSAARNLIGRANRYLTWRNILRYKARGLKYFDFGGWYYGNDPAQLRINHFKSGFGGQVVPEYQCERILTLKGWAVYAGAAALTWLKAAAAELRNAPRQRPLRYAPAHAGVGACGAPAAARTLTLRQAKPANFSP